MKNKLRSGGKASTIPAGLAIGGVVSVVLTLLGASLIAYLMLSERIAENTVGYGVMGILIVSTTVGCLVALARIQRQKLLVSVGMGVVYGVLLLMMNALFFGGQYEGVGVTWVLILGTSATVGITMASRQGGKRSGKRKAFVKLYKK